MDTEKQPEIECSGGPYTADEERQCGLAKVYRALGHPARLMILEKLARQNGACCGQIVDCMPLAQSTVSQHLQVLKEAGILACKVQGRTCHYALDKTTLVRAAQASDAFLSRLCDEAPRESLAEKTGNPD
ncbi:helix-turn-helix transcriptional regulator [Roseibium sp. RKSG952]|uniref:ArsR/SmtB family transcription factor n=1 Tax=Roseibium sp. RKSG952 TaxID=2529384 RepID=UPI0012BBD6A7|nr:metalloregulator ArsR/SmtB family transcription factor [Roseibium sp. RKSG952]MTI00350.1 transcriptional regulator [Roseibium sp. RKSG952]